jgi:hypothetical protein
MEETAIWSSEGKRTIGILQRALASSPWVFLSICLLDSSGCGSTLRTNNRKNTRNTARMKEDHTNTNIEEKKKKTYLAQGLDRNSVADAVHNDVVLLLAHAKEDGGLSHDQIAALRFATAVQLRDLQRRCCEVRDTSNKTGSGETDSIDNRRNVLCVPGRRRSLAARSAAALPAG